MSKAGRKLAAAVIREYQTVTGTVVKDDSVAAAILPMAEGHVKRKGEAMKRLTAAVASLAEPPKPPPPARIAERNAQAVLPGMLRSLATVKLNGHDLGLREVSRNGQAPAGHPEA